MKSRRHHLLTFAKDVSKLVAKMIKTLNPHSIEPEALRIVQKLQSLGHPTYMVGGCVRDLLLNIQPKDYDIATAARPNEVKRAISRSFIIGKRFRLVLARRGDDQYEIATFRRSVSAAEAESSTIEGDNFFGTPEEDAQRRDFTINSLFYDPRSERILDFCSGLKDMELGMIRMIGDPTSRLIEDPIRILRALRLAHKIDFSLETELRKAMAEQAHLLGPAILPRKREEYLKLLRLKKPSLAFREAHDLGLLEHMIPSLHKVFSDPERAEDFYLLLDNAMTSIDNERATPALLFGLLLHVFIRAAGINPLENNPSLEDLENSPFKKFAMLELGVFRSEFDLFVRALANEDKFLEVDKFQKRGKRRRDSFLSHESIELSYLFATLDHLLSPLQFAFWRQCFLDFQPVRSTKEGIS